MTRTRNPDRDSACAPSWRRERAPGIHRRPAHTLVELVVSMAAASLLMAGMGSTLYVAGRALEDDGPVLKVRARQVLSEVTQDLQDALFFSERTTLAATFTVPDRDGDRRPETIRYAWSGTPGDPLTKEYNGSAAAVVADDVRQFSLSALTRFVPARDITSPDGSYPNDLLFVSAGTVSVPVDPQGNPTGDPEVTPTSGESFRIAMIESWGFTVTLISASQTQADFDAAVAGLDVAYISGEVDAGIFGNKLTNAAIGVVSEVIDLTDELGFSDDDVTYLRDEIEITNPSHYITSGFANGWLTVTSSAQSMHAAMPTLSVDLKVLAWIANAGTGVSSTLILLESGDATWDGGTAAGRRVKLPWGGTAADFDISTLNTDGQTIMRRAVEWAAGMDGESQTLLAIADATLFEALPTNNFGAGVGLEVSDLSTDLRHAVIQFDTSSIAPGEKVLSALLRLNLQSNSLTGDAVLEARAATESWVEMEATWSARSTGVNWTTPGGTADPSVAASTLVPKNLENVFVEWDITGLAQDWIDGVQPNDGVLFTQNTADNLTFHSRENGDPTLIPQLVITLE